MAKRCSRRGSAVLYVVVLSPVLMLCLALALEAGALQLAKARLHSAADVASVSAAAAVSRTAGDEVAFDAAVVDNAARQAIVDNLIPLRADIVGSTPEDVSRGAEVYVVTAVPANDPVVAGHVLHRPTLIVRFQVPVSSGLLGIAGVPPVLTLTVVGTSDLRVTGDGP